MQRPSQNIFYCLPFPIADIEFVDLFNSSTINEVHKPLTRAWISWALPFYHLIWDPHTPRSGFIISIFAHIRFLLCEQANIIHEIQIFKTRVQDILHVFFWFLHHSVNNNFKWKMWEIASLLNISSNIYRSSTGTIINYTTRYILRCVNWYIYITMMSTKWFTCEFDQLWRTLSQSQQTTSRVQIRTLSTVLWW